jgi:multiple sugar transport system permease protein
MAIANVQPIDAKAVTTSRPGAKGRWATHLLAYFALLIGAVAFLFPFYYMVIGSISPAREVGDVIPSSIDLANWRFMLSRIPVGRNLLNSVVYAGGVIASTLVIGSLTGYALARLSFPGRSVLFNVILLTLMVPFQLTMIPLYIMIVRFGWTQPGPQTYLGLIVPAAVNATAILIFRQFFLQLPQDLFDAARVDGDSELGILYRIALPLSAPAFLIAGLLTFIGPWNEFLWPLLVTRDINWMPLAESVALFGVGGQACGAASEWGTITAAATILAIPAVALFLVFQRYFVQGVATTGLKG